MSDMKHGKKKKGLSIGKYTITVPGIIAIAVILLAILVVAFLFINSRTNWIDLKGENKPTAAEGTQTAATNEILQMNTATPAVTDAPTPEPVTAEPTEEPTPEPVTLRFIGEIRVDDNILNDANDGNGVYSFNDMFAAVSPVFSNATYTMADIEGSIGPSDSGYSGKSNFNTPESLASELADMGVDMLTLANDHALDNFFSGLLATVDNVRTAGLDYIGAATTQEEHDTAKIVEIDGLKIGFLNYTTTLNSKEKATSSDAVKYGVNIVTSAKPKKEVTALREAGADIIVCAVSWSEDGATEPSKAQQKIAKTLSSLGVDVILGYGTSTVQPTYILENKDKDGNVKNRTLCVCGVGSLINGENREGMDWGTVIEVTFSTGSNGAWTVSGAAAIPTYIWRVNNDGVDSYRVLAIGEWLEEKPAEMSDENYARMNEIWTNAPTAVGDKIEIKAN